MDGHEQHDHIQVDVALVYMIAPNKAFHLIGVPWRATEMRRPTLRNYHLKRYESWNTFYEKLILVMK